MIWSDTISDGPPESCQEQNFVGPLVLLAKARTAGEPFILLSRACVFNISLPLPRHEDGRRDGQEVAGKCLRAAEEAVLAYPKGMVVRVEHLVADIPAIVAAAEASKGPIEDLCLTPVSPEAVEYLCGLLCALSSPPHKIFHLIGAVAVRLSELVYRKTAGREEFSPIFEARRRGWLVDSRIPKVLGPEGAAELGRIDRYFAKATLFRA